MSIENNLYEKSIKIFTDLISYKTISGQDNSDLINYCEQILNELSIETFKVFDENNLSSLPRIILSSVLVILFFYSLPIIVNFTSNKIESSAGIQNNSKAILAYTLNKKSSNSSNSFLPSSDVPSSF